MKRILLFLFIITSGVVYGQGVSIGKGRTDLHRWFDNAGRPAPIPPGYTKINARYEWIAGLFDTALHVPGYNGTPSGVRVGAWVGDGAIAMDTTNHRFYIYSGGAWVRLAAFSEIGSGVAGANTQVQFNNSGAFGASANLTWVSPALSIGVAGSTTGILKLTGATSGVISIAGQAAAGTFNFNIPVTAGTSGYLLTSAGGGASPMTWTNPSTYTTNIYNSDGTITGDRTVTGAGFDFTWNNANNVQFNTTSSGGIITQAGGQSATASTLISGGKAISQLDVNGTNKNSLVTLADDSIRIRSNNDLGDTLSEIKVFKNKININPAHGVLLVDTLTFVPGTMALRYNPTTGLVSYADTSTGGGSGATVALDNLSAVAINAALLPGTSDAIALGSTTKQWSDLYLAEGGVINWDAGDATLTQAGNVVTLNSAAFTVNDKIRSLSVGGIGTGIEVEASGSANYASIDYLNDLGTRFQTGLYGSTAGNPGAAFFFQAASVPIVFFTNSLNRLDIAGSGVITLSNLAGTGSRTVLADAAGVLSAPVSDRSVKEHIKPIGSAVGVIMRLKPVSFEYKQGWKNYGEGVQMGFIAQDIAEVLPNSAFMNEQEGKLKGKMGYNSSDLVPILVRAVQEQQLQINALKKEIQKLKKK